MVGILGYETVGHGDTWTIAREYGVAGGAVDLALGHFSAEKENEAPQQNLWVAEVGLRQMIRSVLSG